MMSGSEYHFALFGAGVILTAWLIDNRDRRWSACMALFTILQLLLALAT